MAKAEADLSGDLDERELPGRRRPALGRRLG
jgi:hypothetical protein